MGGGTQWNKTILVSLLTRQQMKLTTVRLSDVPVSADDGDDADGAGNRLECEPVDRGHGAQERRHPLGPSDTVGEARRDPTRKLMIDPDGRHRDVAGESDGDPEVQGKDRCPEGQAGGDGQAFNENGTRIDQEVQDDGEEIVSSDGSPVNRYYLHPKLLYSSRLAVLARHL